MRHAITAAALFLATPVFADCPPPPDIEARQDALMSQILLAPDERSARLISDQLWRLWATAPDAKAQDLLDRGMAARASFDFEGAATVLDELVAYCPDYAEGYNQRAFVNFLRQDYETALIDLELALERSPRHIAALSGKALTLMGMGRNRQAQAILREALKMNPWLPERRYLVQPEGQEL